MRAPAPKACRSLPAPAPRRASVACEGTGGPATIAFGASIGAAILRVLVMLFAAMGLAVLAVILLRRQCTRTSRTSARDRSGRADPGGSDRARPGATHSRGLDAAWCECPGTMSRAGRAGARAIGDATRRAGADRDGAR